VVDTKVKKPNSEMYCKQNRVLEYELEV
jgi:hypothetical protein